MRPGRPPRVWWLTPQAAVLLVVPAVVAATLATPPETFRRLWQVDKVVDPATALLMLAAGLAVVLGAAVVSVSHAGRTPRAPHSADPAGPLWPVLDGGRRRALEQASTVLFVVTLLGYVALVALAVHRGIGWEQLSTAARDGVYGGPIRRTVGTVAGVTTLTQIGIVSATASALLLAHRPTLRQGVLLGVVVALTLPRAYFLAERLALLEVLVPVAVVVAVRSSCGAAGRRGVALAPLAALPVVASVFAVFEARRSWVFHGPRTTEWFPVWATERLAGYYLTAVNNAALLWEHAPPGRWPHAVFQAFWNAPGIAGSGLYEALSGSDHTRDYRRMLAVHGTPEFRNVSGLAGPMIDLGVLGGIGFWLVAGSAVGLLHRALRYSGPFGLLCYPLLFTGLLEIARTMPWTSGRTVPAMVAAALTAAWLVRAGRRPETVVPPAPGPVTPRARG